MKLGLLALVALVLVGPARVGSAQMGSGSPPPTYDWDDKTPGIQGPTSPLLAGAERRQLRLFDVTVPVLVPLAELQAVLPPGFVPVANPAGSNTGQVSVNFLFQQLTTRIADGQTIRGSGMSFTTTVLNTNVMPSRQETGILVQEWSSQELVDFYNTTYGPGNARLAKVRMQIVEAAGNLSFQYNVTDDGIGLNLQVQATCPGPIVDRVKNDPNANALRFITTNRFYYQASQSDQRLVPQAMANVKVDAPGGKLQVPVAGGMSRSLTISAIGANINFNRSREQFFKEP